MKEFFVKDNFEKKKLRTSDENLNPSMQRVLSCRLSVVNLAQVVYLRTGVKYNEVLTCNLKLTFQRAT